VKITRFEDIEAWKKARVLMNRVYDAAGNSSLAADRDLQRQI